jgi:1-aminocyclopropane-1-carboxylate deaminase
VLSGQILGEPDDELHKRALAVPLEFIATDWLRKAGLELWVRRDDLVDPYLSGNKFYKLFYNLHCAQSAGAKRILSFGGAWSNHLHALAAAAKTAGLESIGIIRGERPSSLSPTLVDAENWGMRLVFVNRQDYRELTQPYLAQSLAQKSQLLTEFSDAYWIPEGGANLAGAAGAKILGLALDQQLQGDYAAVCMACGTGTSLAGVAAGTRRLVLGFSVLKGEGSLGADIHSRFQQLQPQVSGADNWRLISGFHAGGYAKSHPARLYRFWQDFEQETGLLLDPVYTLKLFWGISRLAQQGYWPRGSRLVAIHTGGLQGRRGFHAP